MDHSPLVLKRLAPEHSHNCFRNGVPTAGSARPSRLWICAAKNKPQGSKRASKGKSKPQNQKGPPAQSQATASKEQEQATSTVRRPSDFVPRDRGQELPSEAERQPNLNPNFEDRLQELRQRGQLHRTQGPQLGEDEDAVTARQQSHSQASVSASAAAAPDEAGGSSQTSFWGRAAVGAGALVLVGVFVLATVGVDLGLGGRRSKSSTSQVASLTAEQQKQLGEQAAQLEEQAKRESGSTDALAGAAGSYAALGNLDKSAALLEQLTAQSPSDASAWQALGEVRLRLGRSREGVEAYEKALQAAPDQTVALLQGLTRALAQDGRNKEAVDRLIAVRDKADAPNADINFYEASMLLAKAYAAWPQHSSDALAVYDDLISKTPQDFRAFLAKGLVLKSMGKAADAQRSFLQARYLSPPETRAAVDELAER